MSHENLNAAKALLDGGHFRSAASRAYFAAYAAATARLLGRTAFGPRDNPAHAQIVQLVLHNLPPVPFPQPTRRRLSRMLRQLQESRIVADYKPNGTVNRDTALLSIRNASRLIRHLIRN